MSTTVSYLTRSIHRQTSVLAFLIMPTNMSFAAEASQFKSIERSDYFYTLCIDSSRGNASLLIVLASVVI